MNNVKHNLAFFCKYGHLNKQHKSPSEHFIEYAHIKSTWLWINAGLDIKKFIIGLIFIGYL